MARKATPEERSTALALLRRHPDMHGYLAANVPAVQQIHDEQAGRWVASLGLDPADHHLPGKPHSRARRLAAQMEAEAFSFLARRKAK